ncbi:MAG: ribosome small subunit-dependent GTPase A [Gemmatimonadetes bacterium]|nr:ribosome small subunit-dependent GTPase A [Gemmatimonadota bacterium]
MTIEWRTPALLALGWSDARATELAPLLARGLLPARVVAQHRSHYVVSDGARDHRAVLRGALRAELDATPHLPAVGDWVAIGHTSSPVIVEAVLSRRSAFVRQRPGVAIAPQVVAANIDLALIATAVAGDLNPRRLERYATIAWESGAVPLVLLTKADLVAVDELAEARVAVSAAAPGVDVLAVSTHTGEGLDALARVLVPATTAVLVGSSGVGKSSLVNALLGGERLATAPVRADGRGRHTTTHRELVRLASGALLIDTPGMRELQLWSDGGGFAASFADVDALAADCRFGDCAHGSEPGCAVRAAIAAGSLALERLESYFKLRREMERHARLSDPRAAADANRRLRAMHRAQYSMPDKRDP